MDLSKHFQNVHRKNVIAGLIRLILAGIHLQIIIRPLISLKLLEIPSGIPTQILNENSSGASQEMSHHGLRVSTKIASKIPFYIA